MANQTRTFRVFISSTFSDMKQERGILQRDAIPRLERLCEQKGAKFQAVDLRWGVSEESALNQKTLQICLKEIERCQRISPKPNFLILLGDKYGWQPIPEVIPQVEMTAIYNITQDKDKETLNIWYKLDENAVPPEFILQPRTKEYSEYGKWEIVESELRRILRSAVSKLDLKEEDKHKYFASATHQEILKGALNRELNSPDHVVAAIRTIHNLPYDKSATGFIDITNGMLDDDAKQKLKSLKMELQNTLKDENLIQYDGKWKDGNPVFEDNLKWFNDQVHDHFEKIILSQLNGMEVINAVKLEVKQHKEFKNKLTAHFRGRKETLEVINNYLRNNPKKQVLSLIGESGSGKSSIMAQAVKLSESKDGINIFRFIGVTTRSSNIIALLQSLCGQIACDYKTDLSTLGDEGTNIDAHDIYALSRLLNKCLSLSTKEKPLSIFLDSLDQLSLADNAQSLSWLPRELPEYARIVVSSLPYLSENLNETNLIRLPLLPEAEAKDILDAWLLSINRKLTEKQYDILISNFRNTKLPLYLKIAFEQARKWHSYHDYTSRNDVPGILNDLFNDLEKDFPTGFVQNAICYMLSGRYQGLTEDEILEVLAFDEEYWDTFINSTHKDHQTELKDLKAFLESPEREIKSSMKIPISVWSRLYFELEPYLTERDADGIPIITFYHRQFNEILRARYNLPNDQIDATE